MVDSFLAALANPEPAPGGGAAAAYGASVALALLEKIVRVELNREQNTAETQRQWKSLLEQISSLSKRFTLLRDEDGEAYLAWSEARKSGKGEKEVMAALIRAVECPMQIIDKSHEALSCASQTAEQCRTHLLSDLLVVCELVGAASRGAYQIGQANVQLITDLSLKSEYQNRLSQLHSYGRESFKLVEVMILERARAVESSGETIETRH